MTKSFIGTGDDRCYDFVDSMIPRADMVFPFPAWHGWALREAYAAGFNAAVQAVEKLGNGALEGHDEPCYYCGKPCNNLAGNPGLWGIPLCHPEDPGKVKWHHINCVSSRLK